MKTITCVAILCLVASEGAGEGAELRRGGGSGDVRNTSFGNQGYVVLQVAGTDATFYVTDPTGRRSPPRDSREAMPCLRYETIRGPRTTILEIADPPEGVYEVRSVDGSEVLESVCALWIPKDGPGCWAAWPNGIDTLSIATNVCRVAYLSHRGGDSCAVQIMYP
jgi:hypothetical protein